MTVTNTTSLAPCDRARPSWQSINRIIRERAGAKRSAGIVVGGIDSDGRRVAAYGDPGPGRPPLDAGSVLEIGSITKVFTATLLADMVAREEVALDEPAALLLPPAVRVPMDRENREGLAMGFIKARGSNFYYEEKGEGPPILLIHPAGSTASTWGALLGDLAAVGRVIAYDRRGYSRSGGETVRSPSEHAPDAAAVLEALQAGPAVAVGTSAGATIALDLAVRRPDLVRAVVVHEAAWRALRHPSASSLGTLARMQWLARRGRYGEAAETLLRWVYSYRDGGSAWDAFPDQWRRTARDNGRSVVADLRATMGGYPRPTDLATITAPVVCTYGSRSRGYMRSITRSLAQAIPAARVREIDGAAHAVAFDAPGTFAQVIAEAITSVGCGTGNSPSTSTP